MSALFVRNENGRGYKPTARGMIFLRIWDVLGLIVFVGFCAVLLQPGDTPWWAFALVAPFAIAPLFMMMLSSGRGPIGALLHYARPTKERE